MIDSKEIRFSCSDSEDDSFVSFHFNAAHMNAQEMFMRWVRFMNAIGYVLDAREMESMWNGEYDDSEETELLKAQVKDYQKQIEALKQDLCRYAGIIVKHDITL